MPLFEYYILRVINYQELATFTEVQYNLVVIGSPISNQVLFRTDKILYKVQNFLIEMTVRPLEGL